MSPRGDWRPVARHSASILAAGALLVLAFRGTAWSDVWGSLSGARLPFVAGAAAAVILATLLRALRWRLLFSPHHGRLRRGRAWAIILQSQALNIAVPARLGEVARIFLGAEAAGRPKMAVVPTIALEKLLDAATFLMILAATSASMVLPSWLVRAREGFAALTLLALAATFVTAASRDRLVRYLERLPVPDRLGGRAAVARLRPAIDGLHAVSSPSVFAALTLQSLLVWTVAALANQLILLSLGIRTPAIAAFFLLVVLQLGTAPPSTPGKLGVFQYLCIVGLAPFDVARHAAVSYGLLLHVVAYTPPLLIGLLLFLRELRVSRALPFASLWDEAARPPPAPPDPSAVSRP